GDVHERSPEDGPLLGAVVDAGARLAGGSRHRRAQRLAVDSGLPGSLTMYRHILVAIENSDADATILTHVEELAKLTGASLLLVHVADGWVARHFNDLDLRESQEMREDRAYLEQLVESLNAAGLPTRGKLALGDPATELIKTA